MARRAEAESMMRVKKLGSFGAEAESIHTPFGELWDAFFAAQVLVLRGQKLSASEYLAFARQFGRPEPHVIDQFHHAEHADILILSNVQKNGQPIGLADAGTYFHTDYSYLEVPARATLLYSIEVPKKGGDTLFADQYTAYDDLPANMKRRVDGLTALHHYGNRDDLDKGSRTVASVLKPEQEEKMTWVRHPVARKHPVTGRKALYSVSGSSFGIESMPEDEAIDLLDELKAHATQQKYQLRLKYGVGDVVIWDNASLLHSATLTDPADPRTLWRITVKEEGRTP
jgi:taurine dioxygenase